MRRAAPPLALIALLAAALPLAAATGSLSIESQPGVEVTWDGTPLGSTDSTGIMFIEGIPAGEYVLDLSKPGYGSLRQRIVINEAPATYHGYLDPTEPAAPTSSSSRREPAPAESPTPSVQATEPNPAEEEATEPVAELPAEEARPQAAPEQSPALVEAEAPAAERVATKTSAPPHVADTAAEEDTGRNGLAHVFLAFAIALVGGLAIFFAGRRSPAVATARSHRAPDMLHEKTVSVNDDSRFIESLKERERALDHTVTGPREVIDVEVIDVQEIEGEA